MRAPITKKMVLQMEARIGGFDTPQGMSVVEGQNIKAGSDKCIKPSDPTPWGHGPIGNSARTFLQSFYHF